MNGEADLVGKGLAIATEWQAGCCGATWGTCWTPALWSSLEISPPARWGNLFTGGVSLQALCYRTTWGSCWEQLLATECCRLLCTAAGGRWRSCCAGQQEGTGEARHLAGPGRGGLRTGRDFPPAVPLQRPLLAKLQGLLATYLKGSDSFSLKHSNRVNLGLRENKTMTGIKSNR